MVVYLLSQSSNLPNTTPLLCNHIMEQLRPTQLSELPNPYPIKQQHWAVKCTFPLWYWGFSKLKCFVSCCYCDLWKPKKIPSTSHINMEDYYKHFLICMRKTAFNSDFSPCWFFCITKSKVKSLERNYRQINRLS